MTAIRLSLAAVLIWIAAIIVWLVTDNWIPAGWLMLWLLVAVIACVFVIFPPFLDNA